MKKYFSMKFLYAAFAFLISINLKSITYYVSPSGNDNSAGTSIATAWKTIAKINSLALLPGTIILFEGGQIFSGGISMDNTDANDPLNSITISSYGTGKAIISSGSGIGFYAKNTQGVTVSNLIFEGSGMAANTSDGVSFYTDLTGDVKLRNIKIKNIEIRNYGINGLSLISANGNTGYKDVIVDGVHVHDVKKNGIITSGYSTQTHVGWAHQNVTIKNVEVNNVPGYADASSHRGSGIILAQTDSAHIERSVAHNNGSSNSHCGGPGGIWAWDCNNLIIQYCESYSNSSGTGCDGLGFDLDGGVTNSVLQYNYSHDNEGAGYLLGQFDYARPWANNVIRYNISENDGRTNAGGITLFKGAGTTMAGAKIYNNTIYVSPSSRNAGVGAFTIIDWNKGITGIEVYNNIFQSTGNLNLINIPLGYTANFAGNLYWGTGGSYKIYYHGNTYNNLAAWRTATGNEMSGTNLTGISADPLLVNAGYSGIVFPNPSYQLTAYTLGGGSPAIDAGLNLMSLYGINSGPYDFFNNNLIAGMMPDIGANEVMSTTGIADASNTSNNADNKFISYPNPVSAGDPIFVKGIEFPYSAELFAITGASVWKRNMAESQEHSIPTMNLPPGIYILVIIDSKEKKRSNKVIIE